ncbi:hypothetical protein C8Q77DRAFT_1065046 [Trametes polyzona]|nr:hypothetical protein C8Q77DRAFT_1065046 [Trametes polyzona]
MGRFKGLDSDPDAGPGPYVIASEVWVEIAQETTDAIRDIPSSFVNAIPDLIKARDAWSAEIWAFWFMYVAPIVLHGRFKDSKYYDHLCELVTIMKTTLQYEISRADVEDLRKRIVNWVEGYEKFYYQYNVQRLSTCLLVVHGLLHIPDDILNAGPAWATWTFFMERFCGHLKHSLRSRSHPWAHLDRRATNIAHFAHVRAKYDLHQLATRPHPLSYLRRPRINYTPGYDIRGRMSKYLQGLVGGKAAAIANALPEMIPAWGKVRIGHGGDVLRAMLGRPLAGLGASERTRNTSFVRYETLETDAATGQETRAVHYGELRAILECALDNKAIWREYRSTTLLLALIIPCKTNGTDATAEAVFYRESKAELVVDLQAVQAAVGRVKSRGQWGIIDRSSSLARTIFMAEEVAEADARSSDSEDEAD